MSLVGVLIIIESFTVLILWVRGGLRPFDVGSTFGVQLKIEARLQNF
jgi:hypothetical protein